MRFNIFFSHESLLLLHLYVRYKYEVILGINQFNVYMAKKYTSTTIYVKRLFNAEYNIEYEKKTLSASHVFLFLDV